MPKLSSLAKKLFSGFVLLIFFLIGGHAASSSAADGPAFNGLSNDFSTLQVAKPSQAWGNSASAAPGDVLNLLVWVHNNVPNTTANNVRVQVNLPTTTQANQSVSAHVSADNAATVTGAITINGSSNVKVNYIPGTARLLKNVNGNMTIVNWPANVTADNVVNGGVTLGDVNGCWDYAQAIQLQVQVQGGNPAINTNKKVQLAGGQAVFGDQAAAQPGDAVDFKIYFENTGTAAGANARITDVLDSHIKYITGSSTVRTKVNNADVDTAIPDSQISINGQTITWNFGTIQAVPNAALYLLFQARVADATQFPVGTTTFQNCAKASFDTVSADTNCVTVTVTKAAAPVISFSLRKEVTNLTLGDGKWYGYTQAANAAPGDSLAYRLTIVNTGNAVATNAIIKDILPSGVTYTGNLKLYNLANPNGVAIGDNSLIGNGYMFASFTNGTASYQILQFTAQVSAACSGTTSIKNVAQVIYGGQKVAEDYATVNFSCTRGLIITKKVLDPTTNQYVKQGGVVHENDVVTYQIYVQNNGTVTTTNTLVRDVLPSDIEYLPNTLAIDGEFMVSTVTQNAFVHNGMLLTDLKPGLGKVITFQAKVKACPVYGDTTETNTAYAKADGITEISDWASIVVRVQRPDLNFHL